MTSIESQVTFTTAQGCEARLTVTLTAPNFATAERMTDCYADGIAHATGWERHETSLSPSVVTA